MHREKRTNSTHTTDGSLLPYMRASCSASAQRARVFSQLAAPLARRVWHGTSPRLAREEGRASRSGGLHRLTRTLKHTSAGTYLHIKERRGPPALSPTRPNFFARGVRWGGSWLPFVDSQIWCCCALHWRAGFRWYYTETLGKLQDGPAVVNVGGSEYGK